MLEKLQSILHRYSEEECPTLDKDMVLRSDLGINSYELVQLICEIEEEFSVCIPDRVIGGIKTVQNLLEYIEQNQSVSG